MIHKSNCRTCIFGGDCKITRYPCDDYCPSTEDADNRYIDETVEEGRREYSDYYYSVLREFN